MRIQHNISALNTYNRMNYTNKLVQQKYESLASGYRINRASDDVAGLGISEKMRAKISGLNQGAQNINVGVSLIQTADGGLNTIHSLLNRMVELNGQAMNGTYNYTDREHIQSEVNELLEEITRIAESTTFNAIQVLRGTERIETPIYGTKGHLPSWIASSSTTLGSLSDFFTVGQASPANHSAAYIDFSSMNASNASDLLKNGFYNTCCTCNNRYSIRFVDTGDNYTRDGNHYIFDVDITGITNGNDLIDRLIQSLSTTGSHTVEDQYGHILPTANPVNHYTEFAAELDAFGNRTGRLIMFDNRSSARPNISSGQGLFDEGVYQELSIQVTGGNEVTIQASDEKDDRITILLPDISLEAMGIKDISVYTADSAGKSLTKVREAVEYVSNARGSFGAFQNRLEHSYNNNQNISENLQSSESLIRDIDIASDIPYLVKYNLLLQSQQSVLKQIDTQTKNILQLFEQNL